MADAGTDTGEKEKKDTPTPGGTGEKEKGDKGTPDIQPVIDAIIARERKEAKAREDALTARIAELEKAAPKSGDKPGSKPADDPAYAESLRAPLVAELEKEKAKNAARDARLIKSEIKGIATELSVDPDEVAERLEKHVRIGDGDAVEVVDAAGRPRYGAKGPMTVGELVTELLKAKPYLAKATTRSGIGLGDVPKSTDPSSRKEQLKQHIAELEAKGKFAEAAPLKTELGRLVAGM